HIDGDSPGDVGSVVGDEPTVERRLVPMRAKRDVDGAVGEQQSRTLDVLFGIERHGSIGAARARTGHGGLDRDGAAELFSSGGEIEGMEIEGGSAALKTVGDDVNDTALKIDRGGPENSDFAADIAVRSE